MTLTSIKNLVYAVPALIGAQYGLAQGTFQGFLNLDFESASLTPIPNGPYGPYSIAVSNALPGWTVTIGSAQASVITYNDPALGSTFVTLWATNGAQISGNYSLLLQGGLTASAASISQTAVVPASAASLLFEAQHTGIGALQVSLGGQALSVTALSSGPNYTLYGASIPSFGGLSEPLTFAALGVSTYANNWNIDNIQFSQSPIPEPGVFSLCALGALLCGWRAARRRQR